jgi:hypothetical protein
MPVVAKFYDKTFNNTVAVLETDRGVCMVDRQGKPSNAQLLNSTEIHTAFRRHSKTYQQTGKTRLLSTALDIGPDNLPAMLIPYLLAHSPADHRIRVLLGGLGLGGVPEQLTRLYRNLDLTTVELNRAVIRCYKWFCSRYEFIRPIQPYSEQKVMYGDFFASLSPDRLPIDPYSELGRYYDIVFFDAYLGSDGQTTMRQMDDPEFIRHLITLPTRLLVFNQFLSDRKDDRLHWNRLVTGLKAAYRIYEVQFYDQSGIICVSKTDTTIAGLGTKDRVIDQRLQVAPLLARLIEDIPSTAVKTL